MAFNGAGVYSPPGANFPAVANTLILSNDFNSVINDLASALSNCLVKDGQQTVTGNIPFANFRLTSVGSGVARTDAANVGQLQDQLSGWVVAGGTADAITATYSPAVTALVDGQFCAFRASAANATNAPTFAPNGLTARAITKVGGAVLQPGDIAGNLTEVALRYNLANTRWELLNPADRQQGSLAAGRNIAAKNNAATPNTKLDITADELVVTDASGNVRKLSSVSVTIDFGAATGANGPDAAGAQSASAWSYGWVIYNPATNTTAGLGSASNSAPTMPSGYTFKVLVTAARSDGSTHFVKYRQLGNEIFWEAMISVLSGGSSGTEVSVSLTTALPPNATTMRFYARAYGGGDGDNNVFLYIRYVAGSDYHILIGEGTTTSAGQDTAAIEMPNLSQNLYYLVAGFFSRADISIQGFKLPLGGE